MDWMKLKSGSDVRGVAVGENAQLTEHVAMCLGMAFARYVAKHVGKPVTQVTIAIGRDSRISGPALLHAAAEGVSKAGASVLDFGMCTTPAMYMCIITPGFQPDGSIMITASHHPYDKNGLKFFLAEGGVEGDVVEELLKTASTLEPEGRHDCQEAVPADVQGAACRPHPPRTGYGCAKAAAGAARRGGRGQRRRWILCAADGRTGRVD